MSVTRQDRLLRLPLVTTWLGGSAAFITSIQYGTVSVSGVLSGTTTINAVDPTRAVLLPLGKTGGLLEPASFLGRLTLTNATTVTATFSQNANAMVLGFLVAELAGGAFKSLQYGVIGIASTALTNTFTITSVEPSKTLLFHLGENFDLAGQQQTQHAFTRITLTNATTVTVNRAGSAGNTATNFCALEFP